MSSQLHRLKKTYPTFSTLENQLSDKVGHIQLCQVRCDHCVIFRSSDMVFHEEICICTLQLSTVASAACMLQYYTSTGLPSRKLEPGVCAVCGNEIIVLDNADAIVEKTYKLTCDHMYPSR